MTHEICTKTPVGVTLKVIGGKWKLLVLWHLREKTLRFTELKKKLESVTQKMLTEELRELESEGMIKRKVFPEIPPHVEYSITPYGKTLFPVLQEMAKWGQKHKEKMK